jgi:hypothetical protein
MDPNETLRQLREAVAAYRTADSHGDAESRADVAETVVSRFEDLDQWLSDGGFLPGAWNNRVRELEADVARLEDEKMELGFRLMD